MKYTLHDLIQARGVSEPLREAVVALMAKLEAAEKERDALRAELAQLHKEADKFGDGIDWIQRALQAEAQIEQMERQEPVARLLTWVGKDPYNKNRVIARTYDELHKNAYPEWEEGSPLYLPHGAQFAPSVPECPYPCGWRNLLKHAIEDGAYLARHINEDEPVTENARSVTMLMVMRLRDVLMAINKAATEAKP